MKKFIMCVTLALLVGSTFIGCNTEKAIKNISSTDSILVDSILVDSIDAFNWHNISTDTIIFNKY